MINSEASQAVVTGGASAVAIAFLQTSVLRMIPYSLPALVFIVLDLIYGVRAARMRGDRVRFSTAIKKTVTKIVGYICWIILASTLAVAFSKEWIEWAVLGLVFLNEFASIIGNYLEAKGISVSLAGFFRTLFRAGANKVGVEVTHEEAKEIIKDKNDKPRDAKGRYTSKKK